MLRDGERCLGSHKVVAGVVAMSAQLTQDAGRANAGGERTNTRHKSAQTIKLGIKKKQIKKLSKARKLHTS